MSAKQRVEMRVPGLPTPLSHYTDAVRFGDLLFVSGVAPLDENDRLVGEGDVVAQARQVHVNLAKALEHAGASFADVLKVTVYLTDVDDRQKVNDIRREYFGSAYPASTLVEVSALAVPGMLVEIEAVAGIPG
ncbi:RidA family protein [Pseudonocardia acidicola]|uniref:RidA family protein n=1 Tax=Pseudonocardia acidicola TaxID=2724939 RepID=A0ABX1S5E7_9PSEU|nr:RidA family protein [Pseudonocardia acidicola]NMH96804.1 RidA family protein [Pseudonocardia acidicola]